MNIQRSYKPKLPAQQLAILAVARFADPVGLTSVNPYLPEMIEGFGVDKNDIARWAGLVGATFAGCQSLTAVPWGWASDRVGRKPTILIGLLCTMIGFVAWGFSSSLPMAIGVRAVQGASSGNVGIIRTIVAELVTERELQPRAFALMPLVWSIGSIFGPAFGGFFSRPADQWPKVFGNSALFKQYPFLLPNLIAAVIFMMSLIVTSLFLRETLARKQNRRDCGLVLGEKVASVFRRKEKQGSGHKPSRSDVEATTTLLADMESKEVGGSASSSSSGVAPRGSIFTTQIVLILVSYTFLALHNTAFDQSLPVFLNYPRQAPSKETRDLPFKFSGGFALSADKIGTLFTVFGVASGLIQFFIFPPLCKRFGASRCYTGTAWIFPVVYVITPYLALIEHNVLRYVALMGLMLCKNFAGIVGFPCITILLTNAAPSLAILGTLNGIATMMTGLGKAFGPLLIGAVFTWGAHRGYMIAPWWLLAIIAVIGMVPPWFIVEGDGAIYHYTRAPDSEPKFEIGDDEDDTESEMSFRKSEQGTERPLQPGRGRSPAFQLAAQAMIAGGAGDAGGLLRVPDNLIAVDSDAESDCTLASDSGRRDGMSPVGGRMPSIKLRRLSGQPGAERPKRGTRGRTLEVARD